MRCLLRLFCFINHLSCNPFFTVDTNKTPFKNQQIKSLFLKAAGAALALIVSLSSQINAQTTNVTDSNLITGLTEKSGFTYNNFISGNFSSQYEGRWAGGDDDHDMYQRLRFKTKDFFNNKVSISGSGRLSEDLDGHEPRDGTFRDILDTYNKSVNGRIYYFYADIKNPVLEKSQLRLGRQYQYSVENILFDGAKYEQQVGPVEAHVFGGLRASQYSSPDDDMVAGGGVAFRPFIDTHASLDYIRIVDDDHSDDDEIGFSVWQRLYEDLHFYGRYVLLNNLPKDILTKVSWDKIDWDTSLQLSYYRFLHSLSEQSNDISPFYQILGTFESFDLFSLTGYKGFGEKFGISGGLDYRNVLDNDDENTFNHDYYRSFIALTANNILLEDSRITFTVEYWDAKGVDHSADVGIEFEKKINKFDLGCGTSYSLYKYNFDGSNTLQTILDNEYTRDIEQKINIRTYFLRIKYLLTEKSDVSFRWTTENSDTDPEMYHQLLLSYSMSF